MPTIQVETDELLKAALQLPQVELEQFVRRLFSLKARERTSVLSEREAELLEKIYQKLPAATQQQINELIKKRQAYTITPDELQELIALTDEAEAFDVARLELISELAHLRNVPLDQFIQQLGLQRVSHD
jgi:delta 1-pyrroline-5-carboxylate dehydrogenase